MASITLTNQTNSPVRIATTHFGVNVAATADLVGTNLQVAEIYRDAGLGVLVQGVAPANTAAPSISGTAQVGQTLTAANGTWTGTPAPTLARAWQRSANGTSGWAAIAGATGATYALQAADEGQYVRVVVTGTNASGSATATSAATAQVVPA